MGNSHLFKNTSFFDIIPKGKNIIFTNKGFVALEQIIKSAKLKNKKIIIPAFTWPGFIQIFIKYNIEPIFIDIDPRTFHMDNKLIAEKIDLKPAAIITDHIFGLPDPSIEFLKNISEKNEIFLIEDCVRALGATYKDQLVGSFGQYAFYSLYKCLPLSKGGLGVGNIIYENLPRSTIELKDIANLLFISNYPLKKYTVQILQKIKKQGHFLNEYGMKFNIPSELDPEIRCPGRLDYLNTLLLFLYLHSYKKTLFFRRKRALYFIEELVKLDFSPQEDPYRNHIYTIVSFKIPPRTNREKILSSLSKEGINALKMWSPNILEYKSAIDRWNINSEDYQYSEELSKKIICFPYTTILNYNQIKKIKRILVNIIK